MRILALLVALLFGFSALAAGTIKTLNQPTVPSTGTVAFTSATVGTGHAQVLAASQVRLYLMLHNPSVAGGNTIYCSFGGTATVAGAGTVSIAPGQYVTWESSYAPIDAIDCIASGASTPMTLGVQ